MTSPSRIKLARLRQGLTLTALSASSGLSTRSLSGYESGELRPSTASLEALAAALDVDVSFFDKEDIELVDARAVSFRKLSKTSASQRDAALAGATMTLEFADWLDEKYVLPRQSITGWGVSDPETTAEVIRASWHLADRPVANVLHALEAHGVRVFSVTADTREIDAFSFWRDGVPYIFLSTSKTAERQRFDLAHELGHLVLHEDFEPSASSREREAEANAFASAFLMPSDGVLAQQMRSAPVDRILQARSYWRVSAMAMANRLHQLRLLSDWQYRSTCIELAKLGYRTEEPGSALVPETSQVLRKVFYGSGSGRVAREALADLNISRRELQSHMEGLVPFGVA